MTQTIGRYEIRDEIGAGGMGTVYRAYDAKLTREVAVKVLHPHLFMQDPEYGARFEREVRTVASLQQNSIVPLYDYGQDGEWLYFVMALMGGGTLRDRIARGPLALAETNQIVQRIGGALAKAHRQGIVHRDLKPGNILFDEDGEAYLSDFGIVKVEDPGGLKTKTGHALGTPHYMSPEQLDGKPLDGRSDIYALGIILYEMLTSIKPYDHESTVRVMLMQITAPIPDIRAANTDLPPQLQEIIQTAMAKDPNDRYANVKELTGALENVVRENASGAIQPAPIKPKPKQDVPKISLVESDTAHDTKEKIKSYSAEPKQELHNLPRKNSRQNVVSNSSINQVKQKKIIRPTVITILTILAIIIGLLEVYYIFASLLIM